MRLTNALDHTSRGVYIVHDLMWSNDDRFYLPHDTKEFISLRDVVRKCSGTCPVMFSVVRRTGEVGCLYLSTLLLEYEKQREVNIFSFVRNMFKDSMA